VDFFNVFTFNMHSYGESMADHHSPLKLRDFDATQPDPVSVVSCPEVVSQWWNYCLIREY
jgi:hypothetical protein